MSAPLSDGNHGDPTRPASRSRRVPVLATFAGVIAIAIGTYFLTQFLRVRSHLADAKQSLEQRDFLAAKSSITKCLAIRPNNPDALLLAARIARRSGEDDEAERHLRTYARNYPQQKAEYDRENRLLRVQQGSILEIDSILSVSLQRGEAADAIELEAAIVGGIVLLFDAYKSQETLPTGKAAPFLAKVQSGVELWLRLRPNRLDQVEGLLWRGLTREFANDRTGLDDLRAALALDPTHRGARFHLARGIVQTSPREAIDHLQLLRQRHPDDIQIKLALATAYRGVGQFPEAKALFDELLAAHPDWPDALLARGMLALEQEQWSQAEVWLTRAQQLSPDNPRTNFALASCLRMAGRRDEARVYQDRYGELVEAIQNRFRMAAPPQ